MSLQKFKTGSQGFNKKGNSRRSFYTSDPSGSAFERIFSGKNVAISAIPQFLVAQRPNAGLTQLDLLKFNLTPKNKKNIQSIDLTESTFVLKEPENKNDRLKISTEKLSDIKNIEKIIGDIFNPTLPSSEVLISFSKRKLTRKDLVCFKEGDLPECVIDCYMSMLKINNRTNRGNNQERVIVVNSTYSKILFQVRKEVPRPKNNIFEYDIMIFPIFDGYWTLLSVNLRSGLVHYFDGFQLKKDINGILVILRRFLIQAHTRQNTLINDSFLIYEPNKFIPDNISLKDSGVYICKVAEGLVHHREFTSFNFRTLRKDMLANLVNISLKFVLT